MNRPLIVQIGPLLALFLAWLGLLAAMYALGLNLGG